MRVRAPKDPEYLSTLERGLRVLRSFDEHHPEMRLSEVALRTGLSPAVVRRCLNTLVALNYVRQHGRIFLLRPEVLAFGSAFVESMNLEQVCVPTLQTLRDEHGDSSSMAVLTGRDILYLVHVSTKRRIRLGANVGTRFAAHATSLGRAILAFQPEEDIEAFLAGAPFQKFTDFTITGAGELREELAETRRSGFASAKDELDFGIVSIAVPIFDENRRAIAAINCSTSTTRVSREDLISTRLPGLQEAAREIERALKRWPALVHSLHPT